MYRIIILYLTSFVTALYADARVGGRVNTVNEPVGIGDW
jgi:hypothetical protein